LNAAGEGSGTGNFILRVISSYLVDSRGIDAGRVQMIYGGRYKDSSDVRVELWLSPVGALAPEPTRFESKLDAKKGKIEEYTGSDISSGVDECGCGPPQGNVMLAAFADALRRQPNDVAYIVVFNILGSAPGTWRRVAKTEAGDLRDRGIEDDRIKIIFGGTTKEKDKDDQDDESQLARVQLWILPGDSPPPFKEADPELTPKEAVQIGTYNDYVLKYPKDERRIFAGFVDVLRADEALSVCFIVRPNTPRALDPDVPPLPDEPPDIDTMKLVETWKSELTEKLSIKSGRVIVIPATADETNEGTVEIWVFPAGAALPNPYARDDRDGDAGASGPPRLRPNE
jgi:hypothetical protein